MANGGDKTDPHAGPPLRARVQVQQLDLLLRRLDSLPALPDEAARVLGLWRGEGVEPREVAGALEPDGPLAQRLISLARARAGEREIDDLAGAIDALGAEAIRSAVPAMKVFEALSDFAGGPNGREFWTHCIAAAAAAELAAERLPDPTDPALAFLCGFLHDIGKLALGQCLPKSYGRVLAALSDGAGEAAEVERDIIGIDHTVLGRRLGQRWGLPKPAQEAIWLHHQSPQAVPRDLAGAAIAGIVRFADALARQRGYGPAPSGAGWRSKSASRARTSRMSATNSPAGWPPAPSWWAWRAVRPTRPARSPRRLKRASRTCRFRRTARSRTVAANAPSAQRPAPWARSGASLRPGTGTRAGKRPWTSARAMRARSRTRRGPA